MTVPIFWQICLIVYLLVGLITCVIILLIMIFGGSISIVIDFGSLKRLIDSFKRK